MADRLAIFRCAVCNDSRDFDIPGLTEHCASAHLDGFHTHCCPGCGAKFATLYRASHHVLACDTPEITKWPALANEFSKHQKLQKMVNDSIMKRIGGGGSRAPATRRRLRDVAVNTDICMPSELEQIFGEDTDEMALHIVDEGTEDGEISDSSADEADPPQNIKKEDCGRGDCGEKVVKEEVVDEAEPIAKIRKRRWDVAGEVNGQQQFTASPAIEASSLESVGGFGNKMPTIVEQPMTYYYDMKNIDLMSLPQFGNPVAVPGAGGMVFRPTYYPRQGLLGAHPPDATPVEQPTAGWYHPYQLQSASTHTTPAVAPPKTSKLTGYMSVRNLWMFDKRTDETDMVIEIMGSKGCHRMYFNQKFLASNSPYFKKLFTSLEFQHDKTERLNCSLPVFLDAMNLLHGRNLPWRFTCRGYFAIPNVHRIVKLLRMSDTLQLEKVKKWVGEEIFATHCGSLTGCDCPGCIDRVAIALHFGIEIPEGLSFTTQAALAWLKDCNEHSCAPELDMVSAVSQYLNKYIRQII